MTPRKEIYRRYEKVFVLAYAIVIGLIILLTRFPGSLVLDGSALYKLAAAALVFIVIFYFAVPGHYIGKTKTVIGILAAIFFITMILRFSGYDQSPFFFLYYLTILTTALYLGPRETMAFALLIAACYLFMVDLAGRKPFSFTALGIVHLINMTGLVMVTTFASVLAHLSKQREQHIRSKAEKLSALNTLTQTLTSTLEIEKIFQHVVTAISQLLDVPLCFLWILSSDENELTVGAGKTSVPLPPDAGKLSVGQGLVGWVAAHRQMINLENVMQDSRLQFREVAKKLGFASYLAIPLMYMGRLMGVLEIGTTQRRQFSKDEVDLLFSFASQSAIALNNSQLFAKENERVRRLAALKKYRDIIQMSVEEPEVIRVLTHTAQREFNLSQMIILKKNPSENRLEMKHLLSPVPSEFTFSVLREPNNCLALRSNRRFVMNDNTQEFCCPQNCADAPSGSYLCVPLIVGGAVTGVVHLNSPRKHFWSADQISLAESFVDQTAPILSSLNLLQQAQQRAVIDSLTGLYNRRFLFEFLQQQIVQSKRYNQALSVMMLDLDHFKQVNDTYGHEAGDRVLKLFAHRLKESLRESDVAARYGGEEFVIVLPNTNQQGALALAEKVRSVTLSASLDQVLPDLPNVSVSIGVATFPIHGETVEQLQRAADGALYQAKQTGRNRVIAAERAVPTEEISSRPQKPMVAEL